MAASRESLSLQCDEATLYSPDEAAALHDSPDEAVLYSPDEAAALVARLCEALLGVASYAHIVNPGLEIPEESLPELQAALERLAAGEPLQYVLGYADFLGMRLHVTPAVLIPRPETEELCRRVIESYPHISTGLSSDPTAPASASSPHISAPTAPASGSSSHIFESAVSANPSLPRAILDLCCGSGCITWAMARAFPDALVVGVDLSAEALDVARSQNAAIDGFIQADGVLAEPRTPSSGTSSSRLSAPLFIQADALQVSELLQTLRALLKEYGRSGFDLLLSNPPYVRERERKQMRRNVLDFEPEMALFVPDDDPLRFYKVSAELFSSELFSPHSFAALELNEALGESTAALFQEKKCAVHLQKDVFEKTRFLFAKK